MSAPMGMPLLHLGAMRLDAVMCRKALRDGDDPNGIDLYQRTPLGCVLDTSSFDWAARQASFAEIVTLLIQAGAVVESTRTMMGRPWRDNVRPWQLSALERVEAEIADAHLESTVPPIPGNRIARARSHRL